jgi:hypothetical protein
VVAEGEPKKIVAHMTAEEREEMMKSGVEVA